MTGGPVRVTFVLPNLMLGGAEHQAIKLLGAMPPGAATVTLVVLQGWLPAPLRDAVPVGIDLVVAPYGRRDPRVVPWLAARLRDERTEVVQAFLWYAEVVAAWACRLVPGVSLVGSERGDRGDTFYGPLRRLLDRAVVFPTTRRFVANSEASIAALTRAGFPADRVQLIRNGVETRDSTDGHLPDLELPDGAFVACAVGSLQAYKGVDTLVRAVSACRTESGVHAVIVGDGPERGRLETLARDLGVAARVRFVGRQYPADPWIRLADIGVLSSVRDEACSNAILEFMASGRAVFATNVGGTPELIEDGVTGRLFRANDWRELGRLLDDAALDRGPLKAMGQRAEERVRNAFSIRAAADAYARTWRSVANDAVSAAITTPQSRDAR